MLGLVNVSSFYVLLFSFILYQNKNSSLKVVILFQSTAI